MEKITASGLRLIAFLLILTAASCGKKSESTDGVSDKDTVTADTTTSNPTRPYAAEIVEYRAEQLKGYELYAIYPFEDQPVFMVSENEAVRLVTYDGNKDANETHYKIDSDDKDFDALSFGEQKEGDSGIISFNSVNLVNAQGNTVRFDVSMTKRALTIGSDYMYSGETGSGDLKLSPSADGYVFTVNTNAGDHLCELTGNLRIKGNIGYYQGEPYEVTCKLIFFFTSDSVEILSVSSNSDCGCGANASLNHTFTKR